jgi:hypothetical protein
MRFMLYFTLFVALGGCAHNRQYFRPTERVRGQTLQGYHEAFYDLAGAQGGFGEAKVWSVGAYRRGDDSVVEVTLELHNTSAKPIDVSAKDLALWHVRTSHQAFKRLPAAESGVFQVKPESHASLKVHFVLPHGVLPGEVGSFGFAWKVRNAEQSYVQATPFLEEAAFYPPPDHGYYYAAMYPCSPYDPYCIGFYGGYPYSWYPPPYPPPHEVRRRVDVHR